jgi:signal transduction histidine kinase
MSNLESRQKKLERILEISRELTSTMALEPLLHKIVDTAAELTDGVSASILLLDKRTGELRFLTASGLAGQLRDIPVPVESSIAGAVLVSGEPALISDTRRDPRHYRTVGQLIDLETRSLLAVPLSIKDRHIGVLEAINKQGGGEFDREDVETLTTLAAQAAVAVENARMVAALREAYERLGELDRLKSDFISIASHELRTPLGLILLYAAMLQEEVGEEAAAQLDAVLRAAMRLKHIIETMLNLRYLETGEVVLGPTRVDLRDEVRDACEDYEAIAETGGLALLVDLPEQPVPIFADKEKVRVVLDNLISNAVKFNSPGGRVQVVVEPHGDEVEVAVMDTGIGVPKDEMERIFDRFYQVEDHMTRRHGGMGLGLSIVKGLVELHGGRVMVESIPDQGSRFIVRMPAEVRVAPALAEAAN